MMDKKIERSLNTTLFLIMVGIVALTTTLLGNEFGYYAPHWFIGQDAFLGISMHTVLIVLGHALCMPVSIFYALSVNKITLSGFVWAMIYASANIVSIAVWIAADSGYLFSIQFALFILTMVNSMNVCNIVVLLISGREKLERPRGYHTVLILSIFAAIAMEELWVYICGYKPIVSGVMGIGSFSAISEAFVLISLSAFTLCTWFITGPKSNTEKAFSLFAIVLNVVAIAGWMNWIQFMSGFDPTYDYWISIFLVTLALLVNLGNAFPFMQAKKVVS